MEPSFIHQQSACSAACGTYGKRGSVAENGCGAIAAYNACALLGRPISLQEALLVLGSRAFMGGRMGTNPFALFRFLKAKGLQPRRMGLSLRADAQGVYIALYLFSRQGRLSGHYLALAGRDAGLLAYNDCPDGQTRAYASLWALKKAHRAFALWAWKLS